MSDINSQLIKIENSLKKNIQKELKRDIAIALIFLIVLILLVLLVNRITSKTINKFKKEVENSDDYLKQYLSIIEKSNIVSKTDLEGNIIYVSDSFCDITGYSKNELLGKTHALLRHPETTNDFFDNMWHLIKSKHTFKSLVRNITKDKNTIYLNTTISPILDKNGEIVEFIAHRFDITKETLLQKELEKQNKELIKSQDILKEAQRIAHIGNWEYDFNSNLITFSDESSKIFSLENNKKTIHINDFKKIFFPEDLIKIEEIFNKSFDEKTKFYNEYRIIRSDGKISYVEINGIHQYDNKGTPIRTLCTVHDVSQKNKAQKELQEKDLMLLQQSKMASMGEMLSNIAHQWRQPLSVISTAATGAKVLKKIGKYNDKEFDETMTMINNSVQYLSKTIDDFRNFFKPNENKSDFKIVDTISKTLELLSPQFKAKDILIIKKIENFQIFAMENELLQVLINIMNNARDQLLKKNLENRIIFIDTYSSADNLFIKIKDTGNGIPENIINRIFEPYFTTKHKSEGTGIGLYMCEEIIVKHMKGTIYARNCSGQYEDYTYTGAEFVIKLPKEG
ncbi:MAG: hypothetical protein C0625_05395 [Arcobacter sp.]|nr:MAG: hypothetical protein C0625_05395 [Arcobacter sp.]